MYIHIFSDERIAEELDPIKVVLDRIASRFELNDEMTGVFRGVTSDALFPNYQQHIISIATDVNEQCHAVISNTPITADVGGFALRIAQRLVESPVELGSIQEFTKEALSKFMHVELTDTETAFFTAVLLGDEIEKGDFIVDQLEEDGETFYIALLRYRHILPESPAALAGSECSTPLRSADVRPRLLH